jgi:hypothetical protein
MKKIYKPCCESTCLLGKCDTREAGGCYCICRLVDRINGLKRCINPGENGRDIYYSTGAAIYYPTKELFEQAHKALSPEELQFFDNYRLVVAPKLLEVAEHELETYKIK